MIYWFKPNLHWNVVKQPVFEFLRRFGFLEEGRLCITDKDVNPND